MSASDAAGRGRAGPLWLLLAGLTVMMFGLGATLAWLAAGAYLFVIAAFWWAVSGHLYYEITARFARRAKQGAG